MTDSFESEWLTPEELYNRTRIDDLYFQATRGGITFGGGEPGLYPEFITQFRKIVGDSWKICLETSLNIDIEKLKLFAPVTDNFIIDIKDMNPDIYRRYTSRGNEQVLSNLRYIASLERQTDCNIRLPLIRGFNTREDIQKSKDILQNLGFEKMEQFRYIIKN